ncbi:MAG: SusC/RagA family TonB-linked outer membrane protein, partial [Butyricimonas faecihominis]
FKEAIKGQFREMGTATDAIKYQEGKSMDAIYGLRSVGIDPTSGQRVFLKADGVTTTLEQNPDDLVYLGDSQPKVNSTFNTSFTWKGLSVIVGFGVKWGGKQINYTELNRGENVSLSSNLDRRLLKYGWRHIGDQARYKNQWGTTSRDIATRVCSDFVHKIMFLVVIM